MLTFKEAYDFVSNDLKISNVDVKLREQRLAFLEEYTLKFQQHIPFQNLSNLGNNAEERAVPTPKEILQDCRSGLGGLCLSLSYFNLWVLQALGFDSYLVLCTWGLAKTDRFIHVSVIAERVEKEGDQYFVEVGTSFPTFAPIPLHDLPQQYTDVFVTYKFDREGNTIRRHHLQKESKPGSNPTEKWSKVLEVEAISRSDEYIRWSLEPVYTQPGYASMFYLTEIRITLYPQDTALTMAGSVLKVWKKDSKELTVINLKNAEEFKNAIKTYFPMLSSLVNDNVLRSLKFTE